MGLLLAELMEKLERGLHGDFVCKVSFGPICFFQLLGKISCSGWMGPREKAQQLPGGRTALIGRLGQSPKLAQHILGAPWTLPNTFGRGTAQRGWHRRPQIGAPGLAASALLLSACLVSNVSSHLETVWNVFHV